MSSADARQAHLAHTALLFVPVQKLQKQSLAHRLANEPCHAWRAAVAGPSTMRSHCTGTPVRPFMAVRTYTDTGDPRPPYGAQVVTRGPSIAFTQVIRSPSQRQFAASAGNSNVERLWMGSMRLLQRSWTWKQRGRSSTKPVGQKSYPLVGGCVA
jgi:hypothetical protein